MPLGGRTLAQIIEVDVVMLMVTGSARRDLLGRRADQVDSPVSATQVTAAAISGPAKTGRSELSGRATLHSGHEYRVRTDTALSKSR